MCSRGIFNIECLDFLPMQICCSVFAGVYNEYLIKHIAGNEVDIMIQNVFMYLDSILCNLVVLGFRSELGTAFNSTSLSSIFQISVIAIIVNNSLVGIVTSLFLKVTISGPSVVVLHLCFLTDFISVNSYFYSIPQNLNSIIKAFASAIELVFTAILSFFLLGIPIYWNTIVAVGIVSYAVVLYAQNPLKTAGSNSNNEKKESQKNGSGCIKLDSVKVEERQSLVEHEEGKR